MYYFDETVVLKNQQNLFEACDFLVHDGTGGVAQELQRNPRRLEAFLREIDDVRDNAVIFVKSSMMQDFFETAFPRLSARIVLVTAGEDCSTPGPYYRYLDDQRIIRWFGYNCDLVTPHPKFEIIPLGFADPHWPYGDQAAMLRVHRRMPPVADKPLKALASFHLKMSHQYRYWVWAKLRSNSEIAFEPRRIPPELLWIRHVKYAFEICPRGNGLDCHRTWEALLLRTIPIVRTSTLDPLYEGFPVVIVSEWEGITRDALECWRARYADSFTAAMFERLTRDYWVSRVWAPSGRDPRDARYPCRDGGLNGDFS
jgi:hypothetical protein